MTIFGVYLLVLTIFILLVIIELAVKIIQYKGKKKNLDGSAHDALLNMLSSKGVDLKSESFQVVASKRHLFDTFQNTITIRDFELRTAFDHIASLHEGGHYLSINQNARRRKRFMFSLIIIGLNRLVVIPLFLLATYYFGIINNQFHTHSTLFTVALIFFLIATVLRLSIGMSEEYRASRIAFEYVEQHYGKSIIKYAKQFLIASFCNHLFLALLITIAIPLLYSMFLFAV